MIKLYGNLNQNKNAVKNAWVAGLDCRRTGWTAEKAVTERVAGLDCRRTGDGTGRWVGLQRKQ